jgi:hypothetical protein
MRNHLIRLHIDSISPRPRRIKLSTAFGLILLGFILTLIGLFIYSNFFWNQEIETHARFIPVSILV